ncbi:MAG: MaoC family dehydratase [Solirubrobacteraceae bacterium]
MTDDAPTTTRFSDLATLASKVGEELGTSRWLTIDQPMIDAFADATGDRQWIHVDPERAAKTSFGGTIAHGYLTLSLAPTLLEDVLDISAFAMAVNYGIDRLRFIAPVPVDSRLRMRLVLDDAQITDGAGLIHLTLTFEVEGAAKPAAVAKVLYRLAEEATS